MRVNNLSAGGVHFEREDGWYLPIYHGELHLQKQPAPPRELSTFLADLKLENFSAWDNSWQWNPRFIQENIKIDNYVFIASSNKF